MKMTYKEIATMIRAIGLPFAYHQFTEDTAQPPPFICFSYPQSDDLQADNANYQRIEQLQIDLYSDNKDFTNEAAIEAALFNAGLTWEKIENYIDSERMFMITYRSEVLITQEVQDNG